MQPAALDLLAALSAVLDRRGRWYVFGAQAVVAYGVPRFSADVDVTVKLDPPDPERFVRDMKAGGFALRVDDPDFVRRTRVFPFVHAATGMPLDVVLAGSGTVQRIRRPSYRRSCRKALSPCTRQSPSSGLPAVSVQGHERVRRFVAVCGHRPPPGRVFSPFPRARRGARAAASTPGSPSPA